VARVALCAISMGLTPAAAAALLFVFMYGIATKGFGARVLRKQLRGQCACT